MAILAALIGNNRDISHTGCSVLMIHPKGTIYFFSMLFLAQPYLSSEIEAGVYWGNPPYGLVQFG